MIKNVKKKLCFCGANCSYSFFLVSAGSHLLSFFYEVCVKFVEVHPDLNRGDPKSTDKFLQLRDAYTVLSSTELRREYDMQLQRMHLHEWSHFTGESVPPNQSRYRLVVDVFTITQTALTIVVCVT